MIGTVGYWGWVTFVIGGIAASAVGLGWALGSMWKERERRDGKR